MNLKPGGEEAGNGGEGGGHNAAGNQSQDHTQTHGKHGEVEDVSEEGAGIDALVHDHGAKNHAGTHHTAHGQVGAAQQDQVDLGTAGQFLYDGKAVGDDGYTPVG